MRHFSALSGALILAFVPIAAQAQVPTELPPVQAAPSKIVHLSASALAQVQQDWLAMTLSVQKEGTDAMAVQNQIKNHLASALAMARTSAQPGGLEVSTGQMSVSPRFGRDGKANGWSGMAELVLQGRDIERITGVAGRIQGMTVNQVHWAISPELRRQTENRIQEEAVAQFQARAAALSRSFGSSGYELKEVRVSGQESTGEPQARMVIMQMDVVPSAMPVPAQAGSSRVVVNVSGSIHLK